MEKLVFSSDIARLWEKCFNAQQIKTPFSSFAWHKAYFSTIGSVEKPYILYDQTRNIIAPFSLRDKEIFFSGGKEISDYMDLIGPENEKAAAWNDIVSICNSEGITHITLSNVPESSSTLSFFQNLSENNTKQITIQKEDTTPKILLPDSYEAYLSMLSHKDRHELERKLRKFKRENPDAEIKTSQNPEQDMEHFFQLMRMDPRKITFLTPEYEKFFRQLPHIFPQELIVQFLYVETKPVAAILMFKTDTSFLLYNSGFDQINYPGAGFYIKAESIRLAIEEKFHEYNFLQGNERYKYELGGIDTTVYSISMTV